MLKVNDRSDTKLAAIITLLNSRMGLSAITNRCTCILPALFTNNRNVLFIKSFRAFLFIFLFSATLFAQDSADTPEYALSFGISSWFTLTQYSGQIAVKKILENSDQIRLFIKPLYNFSENNSVRYYSPYKFQLNSSQTSLNIGADYLWSAYKTDDLLLYIGPGCSFYFSNNSGRQTLVFIQLFYIDTETTDYSLGLRGIIGTEWKITQSIGLHSEYILLGRWNISETTEKLYEGETLTRTINYSEEHTIFESRLLFGLNFYF